jgi:hypothetical protein
VVPSDTARSSHLREYHAHAVLGTIAAEEGWRVEGAVLHACASTSPGGGRTSATLRIGAAHPCPKPQACCCSTAPSHRPPLEPCPHGPPHCCAWRQRAHGWHGMARGDGRRRAPSTTAERPRARRTDIATSRGRREAVPGNGSMQAPGPAGGVLFKGSGELPAGWLIS